MAAPCRIFSSPSKDQTHALAVEAQSPNYQAAREVPGRKGHLTQSRQSSGWDFALLMQACRFHP